MGRPAVCFNAVLESGLIVSLDPDGFTTGSRLAAAGETVHWIALGGADETFAVGSYVGDGAEQRWIDISDTSTSPDFEPLYVITISETQIMPLQSTSIGSAILLDNTTFQYSSSWISGGEVDGYLPTGFRVTDGIRTNELGTGYHYVALTESENVLPSAYMSGGMPGIRVIDTGFEPVFVSVTREFSGGTVRMRLNTHPEGVSYGFGTNTSATDAIQTFFPGGGFQGFQVGDSPDTYFPLERVRFLAIGLPGSGAPQVPALPAAGWIVLALALGVSGSRRLRASRG